MVPLTYCAYALRLHCNRPIPGLVAMATTPEVDVQVWLGAMPPWLNETLQEPQQIWYAGPNRDERGDPILKVWKLPGGAYFRFLYCDGTEFVVDQPGTRVWATWPDTLTLADTATYLLGPVLGFVLRLRGITCLHASAVAVGDRAIALVGPPEAGKSTTAATFAERGYPVLSDDAVALVNQPSALKVQPAYPRLGLWPDAIEGLYGSPDVLPQQTPTWDKRYLDLTQDGYAFQREPMPLGAVYILSERRTDLAAPLVHALPAPAGLIELITNTYVNYLLDRAMRAREFALLGRLVARVPLRRVNPHADLVYLSKLCDVILNDFQALS